MSMHGIRPNRPLAEIEIEVGLLLSGFSGRHQGLDMKRAGARGPLSPMFDLGSRQ